ncbi:MAG: VOC family protein [Rubricoccaceae bacterium]|nr:VOC family protein [Rubricoccaceae bacterium]
MSDRFVSRVGGVVSADIAVPDHDREVRFYAQVLTTGARPLWREDLMSADGQPIIGLGARAAEHADLPLQWMPHIQVADVRASVERTLELGGRALMADGAGRWAVLVDPNGAAFGVIPVVSAEEAPSAAGASEGGRIAWLDLTVPAAAPTRDFYREVVGWSVREVDMADDGARYADYTMLGADGRPAAGVCHARGVNAALPPVWLLYLPVGDLAESLRRVRAGGGQVLKETRGADGAYAYAVVQDPVGACIALVPG